MHSVHNEGHLKNEVVVVFSNAGLKAEIWNNFLKNLMQAGWLYSVYFPCSYLSEPLGKED